MGSSDLENVAALASQNDLNQLALRCLVRYQRSGDRRAIDRFLSRCSGLIASIANRYAGGHTAIYKGDLEQEARLGIASAFDTFRSDRHVRFTTYATACAHNRIRKFIRDRGSLIRQPASAIKSQKQLRQTEETLRHRLGRPPVPAELATEAGATEQDVAKGLAGGPIIVKLEDWEPTSIKLLRDKEGDKLRFLGIEEGELFRWAVLIAPLPREQRKCALRHLRGEDSLSRYDLLSRARRKWQELVWASGLYDCGMQIGVPHERALLRDLRQEDRLRREHAAYAVWVMNAVLSVWRRCGKIDLKALALEVISQAASSRDRMLQLIAVDLGNVVGADPILQQATSLSSGAHLATCLEVGERGVSVDLLFDTFHRELIRLLEGRANTGSLSLLWDLATVLGRSLQNVPGLADALERDKALRREGGYLLSAIFSRSDMVRSEDWYAQAVDCNHSDLAGSVQGILSSRADRPLSVLARRVGALALRHLPASRQVALGFEALRREDQPFVRCSIASSLREQHFEAQFDRLDANLLFNTLRKVFLSSLAARGSRKPVLFLSVALQLMAFLDLPSTAAQCVEILRQPEADPMLRGHALFWLGEAWKNVTSDTDSVEETHCMGLALLDQLGAHRDYAANIAQALVASLPIVWRPCHTEEYGLRTGHSTIVWRTG